MPIGPAMTTSSVRSMYSQAASWASCGRSMPCSASQVELLEGLQVGEPRLAQQACDRAIAAGQHLCLEQLHEELLVVPAVVRGLAHQRGVLAADRGQLEFAAVRLEHGRACSPAHRATAPSRWS